MAKIIGQRGGGLPLDDGFTDPYDIALLQVAYLRLSLLASLVGDLSHTYPTLAGAAFRDCPSAGLATSSVRVGYMVCNALVSDRAGADRVEREPLIVDWQTCSEADCQGVRFGTGTRCWAHLSNDSLREALGSLKPGGRLDARGTVLSGTLVGQMLARMRDTGSRSARIEDADFTGARFLDDAWFDSVSFAGSTHFTNATFEKKASFFGAEFDRYVSFHDTQFGGLADFEEASFGQAAFKQIELGAVIFNHATFNRLVEFVGVVFGTAEFRDITAKKRTIFLDCRFNGICFFQDASFHGETSFGMSTFAYKADFARASFAKDASFWQDEFADDALFYDVTFERNAHFDESIFRANACFFDSVFLGETRFAGVKFEGDVLCKKTRFDAHADFGEATVAAGGIWLESVGGLGELTLDGLRANGLVEVTGSFAKVRCANADIQGRAWFRLTASELWLDNSGFSSPVTVESQVLSSSSPLETVSSDTQSARLRSLNGTEAEHLTLIEVDLSRCVLAGLRRPEGLRLVGRCQFAPMPNKWCLRWGWLPWRWTARDALFEEHVWRHSINAPARRYGWEEPDPGQQIEVKPDRLTVMYRQLRAVQEAASNEPGAADLYYGEMEMRRAASQNKGERWLLWMYWLVSGYGLRAMRSLVALVGVILIAAATLRYVGFPGVTPGYWESVVYASGATLSLDLAGRNLPHVLTEWGDVVRIALRVVGPLLLGLALLAVRGRVKR